MSFIQVKTLNSERWAFSFELWALQFLKSLRFSVEGDLYIFCKTQIYKTYKRISSPSSLSGWRWILSLFHINVSSKTSKAYDSGFSVGSEVDDCLILDGDFRQSVGHRQGGVNVNHETADVLVQPIHLGLDVDGVYDS